MREVMGTAGAVVTAWLAAVILLPYIFRRRDLFTPWTLCLAGGINFVGIASIQSAFDHYDVMRPKTWHNYGSHVYLHFIVGMLTFFFVACLSYRYIRLPRRMASRAFCRLPSDATPQLIGAAVFFGIISVLLVVVTLLRIPGVSVLAGKWSNPVAVGAVIIATAVWLRHKTNPVFLSLMLLMMLPAVFTSFMIGTGRRALLNVLTGLLVTVYWLWLRRMNPAKVLVGLAVPAFLCLLILAAYSVTRHGTKQNESSSGRVLERLILIPQRMSIEVLTILIGGDTTDCSLWAIHHTLDTGTLPTDPFAAFKYTLLNPVPRQVWPNKPEGLGKQLARDTRGTRGSTNTWGPGIVGHAYHEGGWHMTIFYGLVIGIGFRFLDGLVFRSGENPYILALVFNSCGQVIGLLRGDLGLFAINIILGILGVFLCLFFYRLISIKVPPLFVPAREY